MYLTMREERVTCPHCWESIDLLIDTSESQTYTEDCSVCCRPILICSEVDGEHLQVSVAQEDLGF